MRVYVGVIKSRFVQIPLIYDRIMHSLAAKRKYESSTKQCTSLTVFIDIAFWKKVRVSHLLQQMSEVAITSNCDFGHLVAYKRSNNMILIELM